MASIRFVHAADLHLDSPFSGLQSVDPEIGAVLREATFAAFEKIIDLCLAEKVDALLVAGDVYDGADRSLPAQLRFVAGLWRLYEAGDIASFICHGNHDPLDGWEARLTLPPRCYQFKKSVEVVPLNPAEPEKAVVYGMSYPQQEVRDNLTPHFRRDPVHRFAVGLLHANVGSDTGHAPYAPCTLDDLTNTRLDYWALGHVHTRAVLKPLYPTVVYPGNPQGRHRNEAGPRGVYLVEVRDDLRPRLDFRPVDVVRWEPLDVSIAGLPTEEALLTALAERAAALRRGADGRHVVAHLRLTGRGDLHHWLRRPDTVAALRGHLNDTFKAQQPFLWCAAVADESAPPFDREEQRQTEGVVGDLLRLVDQIRGDPAQSAGLRERLAPLFTNPRPSRFLGPDSLLPADLERLLTQAEARCVDALWEHGASGEGAAV